MQAPFADPSLARKQADPSLPLVGRAVETQMLQNLLDTVANDLPTGARALTISGEIGTGKTRLLIELCRLARQRSFTVLEARAFEASSLFPYFPFIEALRPALSRSSREELRRYVGMHNNSAPGDGFFSSTRLIGALARIFPELPERLHTKPETRELLTPDQEKFRLLDAIATLLERMALERPLLLCIDNLQWADGASLELTLYLTLRLRNSQIALVGTTRPTSTSSDASASAAAQALGEMMRDGLLLFLPLFPLAEDAAAQHLRALLPGEIRHQVEQALLERSEGNPFFLEELVRTLTRSRQLAPRDGVWDIVHTGSLKLPEGIVQAVKLRLQSLSAPCLDLLQTAALFGRIFPAEPLVHVLQYDGEQLLDEATQAAIIMLSETEQEHTFQQYLFGQGIVQEVLQNALAPQQRRERHGTIAAALEACYGNEARAHAAELARHYAQSDEQEASLRWSLLAGEDAMRQQAPREAINHFLRALKLSSTREESAATLAELHLLVGDLWSALGELERACSAFQQGLEWLQRMPDAPFILQARANRLISDVYRMQTRYELALAHLQASDAALEKLKQQPQHPEQRSTWLSGRSFSRFMTPEQASVSEHILFSQSQALLSLMLNRPDEAQKALWQSHRLATSIGDRNSQAFAMHLIGWTLGWGERIHEAIRLLKEANDLYISIGDPFRATLGDQALGSIYQVLGDMEQARVYTTRGLKRARRYPLRHVHGLLLWNQGTMALYRGNWEECAATLQQAQQEANATRNARLKLLVLQAQAELRFKEGNWQEAERLFLDAIQASNETEWHVSTLALYGHFLAVTGRKTLARAQLERTAALPEPPGISGHFYIPFLAEGYLHLEASDTLTRYSERLQALRGFAYYGTSVDRILGAIAAHQGEWEMAEQAFEESLQHCQRVGNQPEEGAVFYEQARMALKRGAAPEHVQQLCDQALAIFLRYHMQRSADKVKDLREGTSELQRQERGSGVVMASPQAQPEYETLTKRELEALCLVADGHTDREVAEMLVISPRTVNRHLSNIFVKLDVPGRAAAVAYAIRHGLV